MSASNVIPLYQELESASAKRVPNPKITSACEVFPFIKYVPQKPVIPIIRGCLSESAPCPIKVLETGISKNSTKSFNSSLALAKIIPPPTWITGFLASTNAFTIFFAASSSNDGFTVSCESKRVLSKNLVSTSLENISIGTEINTGPGLPDSANLNALSKISGNISALSILQALFTNGL